MFDSWLNDRLKPVLKKISVVVIARWPAEKNIPDDCDAAKLAWALSKSIKISAAPV